MQLHPGVLFPVAALFLLLMGLVDATIWWTRRTQPGFGRWTVGNLLFVVSLLLLASRPFAPDWISVVAANAAVIAAAIAYLEGTRCFRGWRPRLWPVYAAAGVTFASLVYFDYGAPNLNARVSTASLFLSTVFTICCMTLLQERTGRRTLGTLLTSGSFALSALLLLTRALYFFLGPRIDDLFASSWINDVLWICATLSIGGCAVGFILLADERLIDELRSLESQAAAANRELANALKNSMALAEKAAKADAAKTEFVAVMAHEIRNPLAAIISTTELLLDMDPTGEQREYLASVHRSANRLYEITDDALDLSKIEAGRLQIESYRFDLRSTILDILQGFAPLARDKGLDLCLNYSAGTPNRFVGDAGRIRQVVTNLVGNALKFTSMGFVRVEIECEPADAKTPTLRVAVTDSGIGIDPDRLGTLFEKFTPASRSTSGKHQGTGMGLAISKKLVELMGGTIRVESERAKGSRFSVELHVPVARANEVSYRAGS